MIDVLRADLRLAAGEARWWALILAPVVWSGALVGLVHASAPSLQGTGWLASTFPLLLGGQAVVLSVVAGRELGPGLRSRRLAVPSRLGLGSSRALWLAGLCLATAVPAAVAVAVVAHLPATTGARLAAMLACAGVFGALLAEGFRSSMTGALTALGVLWILPLLVRLVDPAAMAWCPAEVATAVVLSSAVEHAWTLPTWVLGLSLGAAWRWHQDL